MGKNIKQRKTHKKDKQRLSLPPSFHKRKKFLYIMENPLEQSMTPADTMLSMLMLADFFNTQCSVSFPRPTDIATCTKFLSSVDQRLPLRLVKSSGHSIHPVSGSMKPGTNNQPGTHHRIAEGVIIVTPPR